MKMGNEQRENKKYKKNMGSGQIKYTKKVCNIV